MIGKIGIEIANTTIDGYPPRIFGDDPIARVVAGHHDRNGPRVGFPVFDFSNDRCVAADQKAADSIIGLLGFGLMSIIKKRGVLRSRRSW